MVDFTVAIPTYNGAQRIASLLEKLRLQINTDHFLWTILVVDNNSTDNTAEVIQHYQSQWQTQTEDHLPSLQYVFEKQQGIAFARLRAITTAQGKWIGFIDDDVSPAPDWVTQAYDFGESHSKIGAYGGEIYGDFEVEPPDNFSRIQSFLAIRKRGAQPHRYQPETLNLPSAAAWVVRKRAWEESVPNAPKLVGRVTGAMVAGDDYEVLLHLHKANWEIWYNPTMKAAHQIPKSRLERGYLTTLSRGCGLCICQLRMINAKTWERPIIFVKLILSNLHRLVMHWIKYRDQLKTDLVAACELEFFLGSFISPFYYLRSLMPF